MFKEPESPKGHSENAKSEEVQPIIDRMPTLVMVSYGQTMLKLAY